MPLRNGCRLCRAHSGNAYGIKLSRQHLHGPTRGRQATFAAATVQLFSTQPSPQPPSPWSWVPTCQFSSYFIILLLVTTYYLATSYKHARLLLFCSVIVYYSLPPPPYAACAVPLRAPLSRSLRGGAGRLGTGPGRTRQSKLTIMHPCAHQLASAPMGPAPRPRARRASLGTGWPGIGPGQGNRARKCSKRRLR